jgi:hypothetical protein
MTSRKPPVWPRSQLVRIDPELPMIERVALYQQNIRTIRASGCKVPTTAMPDTLDAATIAAWFDANDEAIRRLKSVIRTLARDAGVTIALALDPLPRITVRMSKGAKR